VSASRASRAGKGVIRGLILVLLGLLPAAHLAGSNPTQASWAEGPIQVPKGGDQTVSVSVVYDNNEYDPRLRSAWGFACLVSHAGSTVLFDTGGDGALLLENLALLGQDPHRIDAVVLSHVHSDHTGGLAALLDTGARPVVYVPAAFPESFKTGVRRVTRLVEVTGPAEVLPGVHSSGQVGTAIVEQALVVESGLGLVVLTGCAHPGVVEMVRRCKESFRTQVAWLVGGFHLGGASESRIEEIAQELRRLGVLRVAPCHCTGAQARRIFERAWGSAYSPAGVGWTVRLPAPADR
jgi:7,8-dihydropterin-6-yl-methyl-4-(beta-D-ribofuranosyl)aminobenzene 5'-phosphate synthase